MTRTLFVCAFLLFTIPFFAQYDPKEISVKFISETIKADGILDEPVWETAEIAGNYWQYFPLDSVKANQQSEIRMLYDDKNLYVSIKADAIGKNYALRTLERDFRGSGVDSFSLLFDTFNDGTNAFLFGINPYGVRREGLIANGGTDSADFNLSWDMKWQGDSKMYDTHFTSEIIIPLTSLKFNEGATKWRFNSYRIDSQSNERSTWTRIPQNQIIFSLAFMGDMVFEKPLGKSRTPLALIPYINTIADKEFTTDVGGSNFKIGGDAKVAIGNSMNLDITVNPDFSNVEVDDIFTNLTRFEVNLPEKRQFFIDNNDLFGSFGGARDANPFFSRRIGIAQDSAGNSIQNDIIGGVRLSGKLNENWRLGFLNMQTAADTENEIGSNNNMMFALQKKMFSRSNLGMFFINRQSFSNEDFIAPEEEYNRVLGLDYNLASKDNTWVGKFYAHKSFQPGDDTGNYSTGAFLGYNSRKYNVFSDLVYIDEGFRSDLGFIRRTDIIKSATGIERVFWPKSGFINNHGFQLFPIITWQPSLDYKKTDHNIMASWRAELSNQSEFIAEFFGEYIFLTNDFDPTNTDGGIPLPGNQGYHFNSVAFGYESNPVKLLTFEGGTQIGRFFNGNLFSFKTQVSLRLQPKALLSLTVNYDKIVLPDPYSSAELWLISPRIKITFSKSVFWSTLIQYSNQRDNLGFNSRLQWRFAPLSDLFIVYNDNYFVNSFEPRYRSINLKLTYWLNL